MEYKQIGVRLRPQVFEGLTELSQKTRISKNSLVEMAIKHICESHGIAVPVAVIEQPKDYVV